MRSTFQYPASVGEGEMQRFRCLYDTRLQSSRSLQHLGLIGQRSKFSSVARSRLPIRQPGSSAWFAPPRIAVTAPCAVCSFHTTSGRLAPSSTDPPPSNAPLPTTSTTDFSPTDSLQSLDPYADAAYQVNEHIGYLKELGLDYGWGPASIIQWTLEHVYIYSDLPWGGAILATVIGFRIFYLKFAYDSSDMAARSMELRAKPESKVLETRLEEARFNGDRVAMKKANLERAILSRENGISIRKMLLGPAVQIPIGFGTFRLLRGMGNLPVPGFDEGGMLWFTDLSLPDPYFILPIATSLVYFASFGSMTATGALNASRSSAIMFRYFIPLITAVVGVFMPASCQLALFTVASFTGVQQAAFRNKRFRSAAGMYPLPDPAESAAAASTGPRTLNVRGRVVGQKEVEKEPSDILGKVKYHFRNFRKENMERAERMATRWGAKDTRKGQKKLTLERRRAQERAARQRRR